MDIEENPLRLGILLRNRHDGPGGLEKVLEIVAKAMPQKNVELYFYGLYAPNYDLFTKDFKNITYLPLSKSLQSLKKILPQKVFRLLHKAYVKLNGHKLFDQMLEDNLDALITMDLSKQFLGNYQFLKDYKEKSGVPVLSWIHASLSGNSDQVRIAVKDKIGLFDGHLAISPGMKKELVDSYGAMDVVVVYNPVDNAQLVERDKTKFIYIGRIDANKRVLELIKNLQFLKGDWTLDVFGSTGNKNQDDVFLKKISMLGLDKQVSFHGWQDDPWAKINRAGVLLLNSKTEAFGLVIVEAMQRGIPVLAAASQGPMGLIELGKNGWLYPVESEAECTKILHSILSGDIQLPAVIDVIDSVSKYTTSNYIEHLIEKIQLILKNN